MRAVLPLAALLALSACKDEPAENTVARNEIPDEIERADTPPVEPADEIEGATPREERVATLGLLNKRNNLTQDIEIKPGETKRAGNVIVRLATCERTPPWERPAETGAFAQVFVNERGPDGGDVDWRRVFSGWLFKNSPSVNVVEHPVYDVWVKDCAMSFPGETPDA
ncbi:DUF2155 domain-containing protein [Pseudoblastomonas halimionae]|nr:DUF2155 domain-containing protein [Alteriqipengyuania halimionae]